MPHSSWPSRNGVCGGPKIGKLLKSHPDRALQGWLLIEIECPPTKKGGYPPPPLVGNPPPNLPKSWKIRAKMHAFLMKMKNRRGPKNGLVAAEVKTRPFLRLLSTKVANLAASDSPFRELHFGTRYTACFRVGGRQLLSRGGISDPLLGPFCRFGTHGRHFGTSEAI